MAAASIASAFYAGPLVVMVLAGTGGMSERRAAAPDPWDGERVAVWLPEAPDAPEVPEEAEAPVEEEVFAAVAEPEAALAVPVPAPRPEVGDGPAGGAAGELPGTAEVGGAGEGTGEGDHAGAGVGEKREGARPRPKGKKRNLCAKPHPNIREGRDGVMEIDRSLVERYTRNLESFMRLGYSRPHDEGGVKGWYISGFSCVSPVHKAGFRRGDVLLSVNGKKTRSWVGVYLMYQKLKHQEAFEVELVRKGTPMTLRFRVVEG